jgi:hypothetical protein
MTQPYDKKYMIFNETDFVRSGVEIAFQNSKGFHASIGKTS